MDKSYFLNSYVSENEQNLNIKKEAENFYEVLTSRLYGCKSIEEVKQQVSIFLSQNNVGAELETELLNICNSFNDDTTVYQAVTYIDESIGKNLTQAEQEFKKSDEEVTEIKMDLINGAKKDLEEAGLTITGDDESLMERIETEDDVLKLKGNINSVIDSYEVNQLSEENTQPIEIPTNILEESLQKPGEETVLEEVKQQQIEKIQSDENMGVQFGEDGSVTFEGDLTHPGAMNFTAMMVADTMTSDEMINNPEQIDMKFVKSREDITNFTATFGDFSKAKLSAPTVEKMKQAIQSYNPNVDYKELLQQSSPELALTLELVESSILNKQGAFKLAIKNGPNNFDIAMLMDANYAQVSDSLETNGALMSHDSGQNSIAKISETTPGNQRMVLASSLETLRMLKSEELAAEQALKNQYQKKLVYPNEAANVNYPFLIVVAIAEIILVGLFLYLKF